MIIKVMDGLCGAGKTYAALKYADSRAQMGQKVLLVQPTTKLITETVNTTIPAQNFRSPVRAITGATHPWCVIDTLHEHVEHAQPGGEILLITHSAFFSLPHFPGAKDWIVIIDESPQVERSFQLNIPDSHELRTRHIKIEDNTNLDYWEIGPDGWHLQKMARNVHRDEVYDRFSEFAATMTSPHWRTFAAARNYKRLLEEHDVGGINRQLIASSILSPSVFAPFKQVIVAGACIEESMMHLLWSRWKGSEKVSFEDISESFPLRYRAHTNGHLINLRYATTAPWSKNLRDRVLDDGRSVYQTVLDKAREIIGNEQIAEFLNADFKEPQFENAERLPNVSHGLNTYQGINHAFLLAAHNPTPAHFSFLRRYAEVEPDEVQTALTRQNTYQAGLRTSARDPQNTDLKEWFVGDKATADWLASKLPGATVISMDLFEGEIELAKKGRPAAYTSAAEKQAAYRERKQRRERVLLERQIRVEMINDLPWRWTEATAQVRAEVSATMAERELLNAREADRAGIIRREFMGTVFDDKFAREGERVERTFDDLVSLYRDCAGMTFPSKEASPAWSPAHYVARPDLDTGRGYGNIAYCRHIILDNDEGTLTPDMFAALFPSWRMLIHSSWSHTPQKPKWRALIETDLLLDVESYKAITNLIITKLNEAGYWDLREIERTPRLLDQKGFRGAHGFDRSKLNPACVLFLPSRGAHPEHAFFSDFAEGRGPMNVIAALAQAPIPEEPETPIMINRKPPETPISDTASPALKLVAQALRDQKAIQFTKRKDRAVEIALDEWSSSDVRGGRDAGLWKLGVALRNAGCHDAEMTDVLRDAISASRSSEKRELRDKAKRIVRTLG